MDPMDPWPVCHGKKVVACSAVMAMATSYNWLFQWDEKHSIIKWGDLLVLIADNGHTCG